MPIDESNMPINAALRVVTGAVDASGNKIWSRGFEARRLKAGRYELTFSKTFAFPPAVTVTLHAIGDPDQTFQDNVIVVYPVEEKCIVNIYDATNNGTPQDAQFNVIAIGFIPAVPKRKAPRRGAISSVRKRARKARKKR
jgi:hypothetical protein